MSQAKTSGNLLTEGPIARKMLAFAFPLFLGNLFQQLYNTADSLIVGNFIGSDALAAVSSSGSLIFLLVGFFNGVSVGAGVVIARYFGARDKESVERAVHTTVAFGLVAGVLLTVIGIIFTPLILRLPFYYTNRLGFYCNFNEHLRPHHEFCIKLHCSL